MLSSYAVPLAYVALESYVVLFVKRGKGDHIVVGRCIVTAAVATIEEAVQSGAEEGSPERGS
jgi:hypothetical protein